MNGGRFDFDDGGTYCGGWEEGKAHGHGVCTGPKGQGEYSGAWHYGFEVSGIYTWPSGNTFEGQWQNGKRHGLGVEKRGRWLYRGEWSQGYKGRYGMRQSTNSQAKYEGTWSAGLQDGYGTETYADGGTYQGQWLRGSRHGYGIRKSAPYGIAAKYRSRSHAHASLTSLRSDAGEEDVGEGPSRSKDKKGYGGDESRGGFVLRAHSEPPVRRRSLSERSLAVKQKILRPFKMQKMRSTGDINQRVADATSGHAAVGGAAGGTLRSAGTGSLRSSGSTASCQSDESAYTGFSGGPGGGGGGHDHHTSLIHQEEFVDPQTTEVYMGEWKTDKRAGFGISERSDGLKYEGEWFNNKKFGYGATTLKDGTREEGKYKNNILVTSQRKRHLLFVRSSKLRERIDAAVNGAHRASQIALQKADIAISRTSTARDRAEQADYGALQAKEDSDIARHHARQFDPSFRQPGTEVLQRQQQEQEHPQFIPQQQLQQPSPPQPQQGNHVSYSPSSPPVTQQQQQYLQTGALQSSSGDRTPTSPDFSPPMLTPPSELRSPESGGDSGGSGGVTPQPSRSPLPPPTGVLMSQSPSVESYHQQQQQQQQLNSNNTATNFDPTVVADPSTANILNHQQQQSPSNVESYASQQQVDVGEGVRSDSFSSRVPLRQQQQHLVPQQPQQHVNFASDHEHAASSRPQIASSPSSAAGPAQMTMESPYHHNLQSSIKLPSGQNHPAATVIQPSSAASNIVQQRPQQFPSAPTATNRYSSSSSTTMRPSTTRDARSVERPTNRGQQKRSASHDVGPSSAKESGGPTTIMNDHFDQYTMVANPGAARLFQANLSLSSRTHRTAANNIPPGSAEPSPDSPLAVTDGGLGGEQEQQQQQQQQQADHLLPPESGNSPTGGIIRRSTLASPQDWEKSVQKSLATAQQQNPAPPASVAEAPVVRKRLLAGNAAAALVEGSSPAGDLAGATGDRGSLPNLQSLETNPVYMTREVTARLSSQRRQEVQRIAEEEELLQANPLRYLFHPAVKEWFGRWKLPLLVLLVNLCLSIMFYHLLTYNSDDDYDEGNDKNGEPAEG